MAAEVVREVLHAAVGAVGGIGLDQLGKELRLGLAEAVDALLEVADHEAVRLAGAVACDEAQDFDLHRAGVLVLIDEDVVVALLEAAGDGRGGAPAVFGWRAEEVEGHAQDVGELVRGAGLLRVVQQLLIARFETQQRGKVAGDQRGVLQDRAHVVG